VIVAVVLGGGGGAIFGGEASADDLGPIVATGGCRGIIESTGPLFFAFAGYARLATPGEEVVEPARTIPLALGIRLVVHVTVAFSALLARGPDTAGGVVRSAIRGGAGRAVLAFTLPTASLGSVMWVARRVAARSSRR